MFKKIPRRRIFLTLYFLYKKYLEDPFFGMIKRYPCLFKGGNILDIGAGVGYNTSIFSQVISPEFKVYGFEPDESNYIVIKRIIELRNISRKVMPIKVAIGESEGTVRFWHNDKNWGDNRVFTEKFAKSVANLAKTHIVSLYSIDTFVELKMTNPTVKFIKIDVQGYELAVCFGMQKTLKVNPNIVVAIEYAPNEIREIGFQPEELLDFFQDRGFFMYRIHKNGRLQVIQRKEEVNKLVQKYSYINLLFSRGIDSFYEDFISKTV